MKPPSASFVRASISFPPDVYEMLETLAKQKKVSLAWVVREAAEKYIAGEKRSLRKPRQS
jgi:predicted DNA-binding protein